MKTSQEWALETSSFSLMSRKEYIQLIKDIQCDALSDASAEEADNQELEMARSAAMNERIRADQLHNQLLKMREKWLEARKHLRAANKGAERNSMALNLAVSRASSVDTITRRYREHEERKHETIVWNWLLLSDDDLAAKIGFEPTTIIACRKLLKAMLGTRILKL